jgi:hypothetical protein
MGGLRPGDNRHRCIRRLCNLNLYIHPRINSSNILSNIHNILNNIPMCSL